MKESPVNQTVETAIIEIQALADGLDSTDTTKLTYDLKAEKDAIRSGPTSDPSPEWARERLQDAYRETTGTREGKQGYG